MKKILASLLMMPVIAFSQDNKPDEAKLNVLCVNLQTLEEMLSKFNELPAIRGKSIRIDSSQNSLVLFMNSQTKTWTLVEKVDPIKYCILAVGKDIEPIPTKVIEDIIKERQSKRS